MPVQHPQGVGEPRQHRRRGPRVPLQQGLQTLPARPGHVLDHGDVGREPGTAPVQQVQVRRPDPERGQPVVRRPEECEPGGVRQRVGVVRRFVRARPVVLGRAPHVRDRRPAVLEQQPVDALLAAPAQPLHPGQPPPAAEGLPCHRCQVHRRSPLSCRSPRAERQDSIEEGSKEASPRHLRQSGAVITAFSCSTESAGSPGW